MKSLPSPIRVFIIAYCLSIGTASVCHGDAVFYPLTLSNTVVDTAGLTLTTGTYGTCINGESFQQDAVISHKGWQYVAYYNSRLHVCVARRKLPASPWQTAELTDYVFKGGGLKDVHNIVSIGVCPGDGTIHLAFDHHNDTLHYRRSQTGVASNPDAVTSWSALLFGAMRNYLETSKTVSAVCYPQFFIAPGNKMQFNCRLGGSGNGDYWIWTYDPATGLWKNGHSLILRNGRYTDSYLATNTPPYSDRRNAYINGMHYGGDGRLHVTWCWREQNGGYCNHDLCYAYSDDEGLTWRNNDGLVVAQCQPGQTATSNMDLNTTAIKIWPISAGLGMINQQTQAVDARGRIHTVMAHRVTTGSAKVYSFDRCFHYWRGDDGAWHEFTLPATVNTSNRPKLFFDRQSNAYLIFNSSGKLKVAAATAAAQWADWSVIYTANGPFYNEVLGDLYRFQQSEILSIFLQDSPAVDGQPAPIRILDLRLRPTAPMWRLTEIESRAQERISLCAN
ncbi:MAG: BNR repeat-containing protein [Candidatus Sumerlaeota bacterium]|nr:BNR repeat-containing protein [Candidatus Sumerlaeota bacterium]